MTWNDPFPNNFANPYGAPDQSKTIAETNWKRLKDLRGENLFWCVVSGHHCQPTHWSWLRWSRFMDMNFLQNSLQMVQIVPQMMPKQVWISCILIIQIFMLGFLTHVGSLPSFFASGLKDNSPKSICAATTSTWLDAWDARELVLRTCTRPLGDLNEKNQLP